MCNAGQTCFALGQRVALYLRHCALRYIFDWGQFAFAELQGLAFGHAFIQFLNTKIQNLIQCFFRLSRTELEQLSSVRKIIPERSLSCVIPTFAITDQWLLGNLPSTSHLLFTRSRWTLERWSFAIQCCPFCAGFLQHLILLFRTADSNDSNDLWLLLLSKKMSMNHISQSQRIQNCVDFALP